MERVLRRVGLAKRPQQAEGSEAAPAAAAAPRRRRRSRSRRRPPPDAKSGRCLFRINWEAVRDCRSCRSRAITRRLCSRRTDNELYRSNSFKFERFIRGTEDSMTLSKQVSLCDDYSLPADHLAKRRPNSIAVPSSNFISAHFSDWNVVSSPNEEKVQVLDNYSTPRDSQQHLAEEDGDTKCFTSPDKEYSQPYTTDESSNPSSDAEFHEESFPRQKPQELNSPDSINEPATPSALDLLSPNRIDTTAPKRHPSPYYYGDLFKYKTAEGSPPAKKNQGVKTENEPRQKLSLTKKSKASRKQRKAGANANEGREKTSRVKQSKAEIRYRSSSVESRTSDDSHHARQPLQASSNRHNIVNILQVSSFDDGIGEMTRQRHVYETAFDCQVAKSDDDLDQIEKVTNHPILVQVNTEWASQHGSNPSIAATANLSRARLKESEERLSPSQEETSALVTLAKDLKNMHLATEDNGSFSGALPLRGYTPSPPSTAPLPAKFPGKDLLMNSIRSAPNLPSKSRHKDLHLPVKSLRGKSPTTSSGSLQIHERPFDSEFGEISQSSKRLSDNKRIAEFKGRPKVVKEKIYDIKGRPKRDLLMIPKRAKDSMMRRIRHKYSSTESITTSSSEGSMESIKSSTSEGNRSTSSSESRQSASLSSHSSDSGRNRPSSYSGPPSNFLAQAATNKLHILSPISDKSSQEPISETSDNNRNNNSQKCSPEVMEPSTSIAEVKVKRRLPQNKNLLSLGLADRSRPEIQGSDSGISIQSREGIKPRYGTTSAEITTVGIVPDLSDLPFDMPKLRRRRAGVLTLTSEGATEAPCTSGSATSVDLRDLPFDMPKLRRRLRLQTAASLEASPSRASSSQSMADAPDKQGLDRPKLTLNLGEIGSGQRTGLGFTLTNIGSGNDGTLTNQCNSGNIYLSDSIDVNLPLEKQVWFHGSITRVEAENVLRVLREGSFLVRNSESIKNDFSLSLKSARGFMHMRIQKNSVDGTFILGQFSKPFPSIPEMIRHFSVNRLPIRGAEHMCLLQPVIAQLL